MGKKFTAMMDGAGRRKRSEGQAKDSDPGAMNQELALPMLPYFGKAAWEIRGF